MGLICNATRLDNWKGWPEPTADNPMPYEDVVKLLRWMADEIEKTKENIIMLPVFRVRWEDDKEQVQGLGISARVVSGKNFGRRLKEVGSVKQ